MIELLTPHEPQFGEVAYEGDGRDLLTLNQAAGHLGVTEDTLRDLRRGGKISFVRWRSNRPRICYRVEDCDAFIAAHGRGGVPPDQAGRRIPPPRPARIVPFSERPGQRKKP